jgi:large subunit ribosomal protein L15
MVSRTNKFRGSRTHGRGKKSGRGAGIHGGRGNAGLHKHKYMRTLKYDPLHFGVHGFKRPAKVLEKREAMTVRMLSHQLEALVSDGKAKKEGDSYAIDLASLGYYKLIGSGRLDAKVHVTVGNASERARASIEAAGGSVTLK